MPEYQRLFEVHRHLRRSVADAIKMLCDAAGFGAHDRAKIHVGLIGLASNDTVGLVDVRFEAPRGEKVYVVSLPTSSWFRASSVGVARRDEFEIDLLDDASVDAAGNCGGYRTPTSNCCRLSKRDTVSWWDPPTSCSAGPNRPECPCSGRSPPAIRFFGRCPWSR